MSSIDPSPQPPILEGTDAVPIANTSGDPTGSWPERPGRERPPRRIDGQFCPFCGGRIPGEFVFCINCGRDV